MTNKFWIINLVLFQLAWFCCALLTTHASWILPCIIALHFLFSPKKSADLKLCIIASSGVIIDFCLMQFNVIYFASPTFPLWLVCLWLIFTISLNHSLAWLNKFKLWQISLLGAISGASSYLAAIKIGAINTPLSLIDISATYVVVWALLLPCMILFQRRVVLLNTSH
jgi:hypothetical protein